MFIQKTHATCPIKYNQTNSSLKMGKFGIRAVSFGKLTQIQWNSIEFFILNLLKKLVRNNKNIKYWKSSTFNLTLTKLSPESRMGKGKGSIYTKANFLRPGTILFEVSGITYMQATEIFRLLKKKLPIKISFIKKNTKY